MMRLETFFPEAQLHIPFTLNGCQGRVAVYYGPNDDAVKAGFDALPGINFPLAMCQGYPVMEARIESYGGSGYRMFCGWIQIITRTCFSADDTTRTNPQISRSVDLVPAMYGTGVPFVTYGHLPSIFDAPCLNLGDNAELIWTADTFLTTVPLRSRLEGISWLLGFRWGYREYDNLAEKPVTLSPLEVTDREVWKGPLPFLRREFDTWRFEQASS
ncbi:MAG: hypothetical protein E4H27_08445 [Anaerolineales bacterium]|nr:MAG: hypothetical protein E4H27_08445 [Anaerolineales bacterium]